MFGSVVLEVFIGLLFLYLLLGLIVTAAQEFVAALFKLRAGTLASGIETLLVDPRNRGLARSLSEALYAHPLVLRLYASGGRPRRGFWTLKGPSYLPGRTFSLALLDTLRRRYAPNPEAVQPIAAEELLAQAPAIVRNLPDGDLKAALTLLVGRDEGAGTPAGARGEQARRAIEGWFDEAMERVSGWYKRRTQYIAFLLALLLAIAVNADSIGVARHLWDNKTLRDTIVAAAEEATRERAAVEGEEGEQPPLAGVEVAGLLQQVGSFPLGWDEEKFQAVRDEPKRLLIPLLGWLMTAFAACLGAGFWFDALKRLLHLRASGGIPGGAQSQARGR